MADTPTQRRAVVLGAAGGIGAALARALAGRGYDVIGLSRRGDPPIDLTDEASLAEAAEGCGEDLDCVILATGFLHGAGMMPEKSFRQVTPAQLAHAFAINATGPALAIKHFLPRLSRHRPARLAALSARVGSIGDNALGGWMSYRASKAALNMLIRCAAIELARANPGAICVALHPGTVETPLSAPFAKAGLRLHSPAEAAERLLDVLASLSPAQSGQLLDGSGCVLPF